MKKNTLERLATLNLTQLKPQQALALKGGDDKRPNRPPGGGPPPPPPGGGPLPNSVFETWDSFEQVFGS